MAALPLFLMVIIVYLFILFILYLFYIELSNKQLNEDDLRRIYKQRKSVILKNATIKETLIHTKILLEHTTSPIKIVSGFLRKELYCDEEILALIKKQIKKDNHITILTYEKENSEVLDLLNKLKEDYKTKLSIHFLSKPPKRNFIVSKPYFRLESDTKDFRAVVGKDDKVAEKLELVFSQINSDRQ